MALWYIPAVKAKIDTLILKVSGSGIEGVVDEVASELPVRLVLNGEALVTLLCTPTELEELAVGFLLSEGLLHDRSSLRKLAVLDAGPSIEIEIAGLPKGWEKQFEKRTISSGCGKGITFTNYDREKDRKIDSRGPVMTVGSIRDQLIKFRNISALYLETGGVHSAALSDGKDILFFSEDIGRHNAVDKLIGKAFLKDVSIENKVLITSGRVTSEIVTKAGRNRFPILISRAAPSCMAISYAEDIGITLIGFARGDRMNIYSWPNRITQA
jgi:FdhD protein